MTETHLGFLNFARLVLDALVAADVEYMIGGSAGLWAWGAPRTTDDFDLVVDLPFEKVFPLSKELAHRDMLVPPDIMVDLLIQPEGDLPINAIHPDSGYKAELFLLREGDVFRQNALARRRVMDLGVPLGEVYVHAPEDLILNKIRYYSLNEQTKHIRDIASILVISRKVLDNDYLTTWINTLGLNDTWQDMQDDLADHMQGIKLF